MNIKTWQERNAAYGIEDWGIHGQPAAMQAEIDDLRAALSAQQEPAAPGWQLVPVELVKFLNGEGPLDGVWFGDKHPTERGAFWWRKRLQAAPQPQQVTPVAAPEVWPCVVVEADFEENTVTVEMKSNDWRIHAGEYFLSAAPAPQQGGK